MADRPPMHNTDSVALREYIEALLQEHQNLHTLLLSAHLRDHELLADTVRTTSEQLALTMRTTATQLADTMKTTADTHWKNHEREHELSDRALDKAQESVAQHLAQMTQLAKENKADANEWRSTMNDREVKFATKDDVKVNAKDITDLQKWRERGEGRSSGLAPIWAIALTIIGSVIGALILHFLLAPK